MKTWLKNTTLAVLAIAAGIALGGYERSATGQAPAVNTNLLVHSVTATAVSSNEILLQWKTDTFNNEPPRFWTIYRDGVWIATVTNRLDAPIGLQVFP